jgi:hypothetical protein
VLDVASTKSPIKGDKAKGMSFLVFEFQITLPIVFTHTCTVWCRSVCLKFRFLNPNWTLQAYLQKDKRKIFGLSLLTDRRRRTSDPEAKILLTLTQHKLQRRSKDTGDPPTFDKENPN